MRSVHQTWRPTLITGVLSIGLGFTLGGLVTHDVTQGVNGKFSHNGAHKYSFDIEMPVGLRDVRLHDLRRSVGSWMTGAGVDLNLIRDALRHANISTTLTYARLGADAARAAMEDHGRRILDAATGLCAETDVPSNPIASKIATAVAACRIHRPMVLLPTRPDEAQVRHRLASWASQAKCLSRLSFSALSPGKNLFFNPTRIPSTKNLSSVSYTTFHRMRFANPGLASSRMGSCPLFVASS